MFEDLRDLYQEVIFDHNRNPRNFRVMEIVKGKTEQEAEELFKKFHEMTTGKDENFNLEAIGKLAVLAGVREYPARVKCATLAWHTLDAALKNEQKSISTE
jgi:nitrogen fixation NifU-like protein